MRLQMVYTPYLRKTILHRSNTSLCKRLWEDHVIPYKVYMPEQVFGYSNFFLGKCIGLYEDKHEVRISNDDKVLDEDKATVQDNQIIFS